MLNCELMHRYVKWNRILCQVSMVDASKRPTLFMVQYKSAYTVVGRLGTRLVNQLVNREEVGVNLLRRLVH